MTAGNILHFNAEMTETLVYYIVTRDWKVGIVFIGSVILVSVLLRSVFIGKCGPRSVLSGSVILESVLLGSAILENVPLKSVRLEIVTLENVMLENVILGNICSYGVRFYVQAYGYTSGILASVQKESVMRYFCHILQSEKEF